MAQSYRDAASGHEWHGPYPGIIRNRLKIDAAIAHHPRSRPEWVKLFKETFRVLARRAPWASR